MRGRMLCLRAEVNEVGCRIAGERDRGGSCASSESNQAVDALPVITTRLEHNTRHCFAVKKFEDSENLFIIYLCIGLGMRVLPY